MRAPPYRDSTMRPNMKSHRLLSSRCRPSACRNIAVNRRQYWPSAMRDPDRPPASSKTVSLGPSESLRAMDNAIQMTTLTASNVHVTYGFGPGPNSLATPGLHGPRLDGSVKDSLGWRGPGARRSPDGRSLLEHVAEHQVPVGLTAADESRPAVVDHYDGGPRIQVVVARHGWRVRA